MLATNTKFWCFSIIIKGRLEKEDRDAYKSFIGCWCLCDEFANIQKCFSDTSSNNNACGNKTSMQWIVFWFWVMHHRCSQLSILAECMMQHLKHFQSCTNMILFCPCSPWFLLIYLFASLIQTHGPYHKGNQIAHEHKMVSPSTLQRRC